MIIKHHGVLLHIAELCKDAPVVMNMSITHHDDLSLYISPEEENFLIIQARDAFVKKQHKPAPFHSNFFYKHSRALFDEQHVRLLKQDREKLLTFAAFLDT